MVFGKEARTGETIAITNQIPGGMYYVHQTPLSSWSRAAHKFFSLGVLTFAANFKQLCAMAMCYIFQIHNAKNLLQHPLVYGLVEG